MVITADYVRRIFVNIGDLALDHNFYNQFINGVRTPVIPSCGATPSYTPGVECSNGSITVFTSEGRAVYNGLLVKLNKRFSSRYQFVASYALQTNSSTATSAATTFNLNNLFASYGDVLARQNLNVAAIVRLPWGGRTDHERVGYRLYAVQRLPFGHRSHRHKREFQSDSRSMLRLPQRGSRAKPPRWPPSTPLMRARRRRERHQIPTYVLPPRPTRLARQPRIWGRLSAPADRGHSRSEGGSFSDWKTRSGH
jgi:hypothetical protein